MTRKVSHPDILSRPHGKSFFTGKYKSERWTIILVGFHWADGIKKLEFFCDIGEIVSTVFHISIICCHYIKCFFDWSEAPHWWHWVTTPTKIFIWKIYLFQNKNECGLKQGARERFNRRIFQWQWREIEIRWSTGAGKRRTRSGMVIEEEERGRWKRSIRRGWGGWRSSGQKSQWASFSPLLQVDLSRCRSCHYFKAWYFMHICRNRTILRSCPRWKVILRTWETNGWLWLQVAGSGWMHLVNFILHFWDILPSCLIIALPSVWVASYLEGYSKAPLFNLKWQFCPVCAPLAELMRIVNYAIC